MAFLERAWEENQVVLYLKSNSGEMSVDPAASVRIKFQDVDLAKRLVEKLKVVRQFGKLGVFRFLQD